MRKKLNKAISQYGINSKEVRKISDELDRKIAEYYKSIEHIKYPPNSKMLEYKNISYKKLKEITIKNKRFPTVIEWNNIAKEKGYLSHLSIEYMMKTNWNDLRVKTLREFNIEI